MFKELAASSLLAEKFLLSQLHFSSSPIILLSICRVPCGAAWKTNCPITFPAPPVLPSGPREWQGWSQQDCRVHRGKA